MKASVDDTDDIKFLENNLAEQAFPRLLDIKNRVETGGELSDADIRFMSQVTLYARQSKQLIDRLPEWQKFFTDVFYLYGEIIEKAVSNVENPEVGHMRPE